jgi:alkylation response protein AidB-like acyl-CoA dehydrogenase
MDFELTEEQRALRRATADFAREEIAPRVARMDAEDRFPGSLRDSMRRRGLWGLPFPAAYDGGGLGYLDYVIALEQIAQESLAVAATLSVHTMAAATVFHHGTDEQRRRWLPPLLAGDEVGTFSFTELATGSNPAAITTTAERNGHGFVLSGQKMFASNSTLGGAAIIFAKDKEQDDRITAFVVAKHGEGYRPGTPVRKMGLGGFETAPFVLDGYRVAEDGVLGGEAMRGRGFDVLLDMITIGKLGIAAQSLGLAGRALREAVTYAGQRRQLNKPLRMFSTIQALVAEMATAVEASRWMAYHAAFRRDAGHGIAVEAAMAKLFCAETAKVVVDKSLSVHGCYGYTKEFTVERLYREVKLGELYEGTPEMQKLLIASKVLWQGEARQ